MITVIPCCHVVTAINLMERSPNDYILVWFRKETYVECYKNIIYPTNWEKMWLTTPYLDVLAPLDKRRTRRAKKKRTKDVTEKEDEVNKKVKLSKTTPTTITRKGIAIKSSKCGQEVHNRKKCGGPATSSSIVGGSTESTTAASSSIV